jgi:hypothetical protein
MKAPSAGFFGAKLYSRTSETEFASGNASRALTASAAVANGPATTLLQQDDVFRAIHRGRDRGYASSRLISAMKRSLILAVAWINIFCNARKSLDNIRPDFRNTQRVF